MQEGQVFDTKAGGYDATGQISASGTQLSFVGLNYLNGSSIESIVFGGNCTTATSDADDVLAGTISGFAGSVNFTYTEYGNTFNVTAILSADGKSIIGTYAEQVAQTGQNGSCNGAGTILDQGSVTGTLVSKLSGTYVGKFCEPLDVTCLNGPLDTATATLSENGSTLTANIVLTGVDNTVVTLTGPVAGNFLSIQGTFGGQSVAYDGYFQNAFDSTDGLYDIPTLYLDNVNLTATPPTQVYAGTLVVPLVQ